MMTFESSGSFKNTEDFFKRMSKQNVNGLLKRFGEIGVSALAKATPMGSGKTASSWDYRIKKTSSGYTVEWFNTHVNDNAVVAILIQYGHGTGTGGYVAGRDYINPVMRPIFDKIITDIWGEVQK